MKKLLSLALAIMMVATLNLGAVAAETVPTTQSTVLPTGRQASSALRRIKKNQKIVLRISDNGVGISPEFQDKIFDRFYRAQESRSRETGGYGLGLSIVKAIMTCHEAEIFIDSTLGEGTTFVMAFGGEQH